FDRARIRPLVDQRHAYSTFHYAHRQDSRHELGLDRGCDGTGLPDLLGLRALDTSLIARVRAQLPRIRRDELLSHSPPSAFDEHASFDLDVLAEAAAAALALPDLSGAPRPHRELAAPPSTWHARDSEAEPSQERSA